MKILILGCGKLYLSEKGNSIGEKLKCGGSRNFACSQEEWNKICDNGTEFVFLDKCKDIEPDIIANIKNKNWYDKVEKLYGNDFDIIIDSISHICYWLRKSNNYYNPVNKLLKENGIFYCYKKLDKYKEVKYIKKDNVFINST
jgi:hypothetical protein